MTNFQQATSVQKLLTSLRIMAANLLSIAEASHEIQIDEEKLRYICSKVNVWDHYSITKSQYVSLSNEEKLRMLKGF